MHTQNKFVIASLLLIVSSACNLPGSSSDSTPAAGGSSGPTLSGNFATPCTALGTTLFGTSTHVKRVFNFTGAAFSYSVLFFTSSACTTETYTTALAGAFAVGSVTSSPAGGNVINFVITTSSVTVYDFSGTSAAINTACSTSFSSGAGALLLTSSSGLSCSGGGISIPAANANVYNAFVLNGTTLSMGTVGYNIPGVASLGSLPTSTSIDFTQF